MKNYILLIFSGIIFYHTFSLKKFEKLFELTESREIFNIYADKDDNPVSQLEHLFVRRGIRFPLVAMAQSMVETGWMTSVIYRENKNMFGMKLAKSRQIALGIKRGHAYYKNQVSSIDDYAAWQKRMLELRPCHSEEDYLNLLNNLPVCKGCRYAEDLNYVEKVRYNITILKNIKNLEG